MQLQTIWQQGSDNPENPNNLAIIRDWWQEIGNQEIFWQQRIVPPHVNAAEMNWEVAKFDEKFLVVNPELRGMTLYWRRLDTEAERNTTPDKLILDRIHQALYIFVRSQPGLVVRVSIPTITYQTIEISNPQWEYSTVGDRTLSLRDDTQQIEVKVSLTPENLKQLMRELLKQDKL